MLVTGCALLLLAPSLARGRRLAWWGTIVALLVSFIFHLRTGIPRLETGLALGFLLLLLAWANQFQASSGAVTLSRGRRVLWVMLVFLPLYGVVGFWLLRTKFAGSYHPLRVLERTAACLLFSGGTPAPTSDFAHGFLASIPLLGWAGLLYGLALLLRGATGASPLPAEQRAARRIVAAHGRSGTAYMTLWPGNSLFLGPGEQSYLAYRVCADVAVVLGDPIGPPESVAPLVNAFIKHAMREGWEAVFYAATEEKLPAYRESGYEALQVGEEAVIPLAGLEFKGKEWQSVRSAINRASREKVAFQLYEGGTVPAPVREQFFAISAAWETQRKLPPMGFTLGCTEDVDDPNVAVATAVGADGRVHAFVDWLPVYAQRGWVIDLMRRHADGMSGVMEFLIASSLLAFRDRGYAQASLATAPLANLDRNTDASLLQQVLGLVYNHFDTYYRFKSLFEFKDKFQPRWEGIYLVHPGPDRLPRAVQALVQAHLPGLDARKVLQILGSSVAEKLFTGDDATAT
jgi:phosphatidylglycerol lysyltransferase